MASAASTTTPAHFGIGDRRFERRDIAHVGLEGCESLTGVERLGERTKFIGCAQPVGQVGIVFREVDGEHRPIVRDESPNGGGTDPSGCARH